MLRTILFSALLLPIMIFGQEKQENLVSPVATELKSRLPEWRPQIYEQFPNGSPKLVLFYTENDAGMEEAVKRIQFYENGRPLEEADLTVVKEDSPGYEMWKSTAVPHGVTVRLRENGEMERIAYFDRGLLHGPMKVFYPKGQVNHMTTFKQGQPDGKIYSYHENGQVSAEGFYQDGKLEGDYTRFFAGGQREVLIPYVNGEIHGKLIEWYENGNEKTQANYQKGKLQSSGSQPAVVRYDENHSILEVQDYHNGDPSGDHIKYHSNERQSYHVHYVDGKKHGKEEWFGSDGKLIGEGEYDHGKSVGKHWKKHPNGTLSYMATYDKKGRLNEPAREFDENGQKTAEYIKNPEEKLDGHYQSWYSNGQLQIDCYYVNGEFDGEQKQFYLSGQLKLHGMYKNQLRHGLFQEWNEDGSLAFEGTFNEGNKEGSFTDWYTNGQMKMCKHFKQSLFHGDQNEWYENGAARLEARYDEGKKDGTLRTWNDKGKLLFEGAFDQDKPIGAHVAYYENGEKLEGVHFLDGKKEGKHEFFYPNGKLKISETF